MYNRRTALFYALFNLELSSKPQQAQCEQTLTVVIFQVEKIIDSKRIKGKLHYLIRWKGYSASQDTWEPQDTLSCPELINKYNEEVRFYH